MKTVPINESVEANITQMRDGDAFGGRPEELLDGNMIPRLCKYVGDAACKDTCKLLETSSAWPEPEPGLGEFQGVAGTQCAEVNVLTTLERLGTKPENFVLASCTGDRGVAFGDELDTASASKHESGYTVVPATNAFFFRPGMDKTPEGAVITHAAMRMADCGDAIYTFLDDKGQEVVGIVHYSRMDMRGPSAFTHGPEDKPVSWGEEVLGCVMEHYSPDPSTVHVKLVAAVNREHFVHTFADKQKMEKTFPGWDELGFMHPQGEKDFDCLIDYREMIAWQIGDSVQNPALRLRPEQIDASDVIDTGDLSLGHASHRAFQQGKTQEGRDMYIVGTAHLHGPSN